MEEENQLVAQHSLKAHQSFFQGSTHSEDVKMEINVVQHPPRVPQRHCCSMPSLTYVSSSGISVSQYGSAVLTSLPCIQNLVLNTKGQRNPHNGIQNHHEPHRHIVVVQTSSHGGHIPEDPLRSIV